jgi:hypothetical protein
MEGNETGLLESITSRWHNDETPSDNLSSEEAILTYRNHKEQAAIAPDQLKQSIRRSIIQQPTTYQQVRIDPPPSMCDIQKKINRVQINRK